MPSSQNKNKEMKQNFDPASGLRNIILTEGEENL